MISILVQVNQQPSSDVAPALGSFFSCKALRYGFHLRPALSARRGADHLAPLVRADLRLWEDLRHRYCTVPRIAHRAVACAYPTANTNRTLTMGARERTVARLGDPRNAHQRNKEVTETRMAQVTLK